jgi:hypothetical protein
MEEDEPSNIEKRPSRTPANGDWLSRRGGWVLVPVGLALIALAADFADEAAVARSRRPAAGELDSINR